MKKEKSLSKFKILTPAFLSWHMAGYDLVLLVVMQDEIVRFFFQSANTVESILAVFATLSISLLGRIIGGVVFGMYANNNGRKKTVRICLIAIVLISFSIAIFLPNTNQIKEFDMPIIISPFIFVLSRFLTGFFVGGIWPTSATFALSKLEEFYNSKQDSKSGVLGKIEKSLKKIGIYTDKDRETGRFKIEGFGWQSAFIQVGFHSSFVFAVLLNYGFEPSLLCENLHLCHNDIFLYSSDEPEKWRWMFLIGIPFILPNIFLLRYWVEDKEKHHYTFSKAIHLLKSQYYGMKINSIWIILTGAMYLYYATTVMIPQYLSRSNDIQNCGDFCANPVIIVAFVSLVAHFWLGPVNTILWNKHNTTSENNAKKGFFNSVHEKFMRFTIKFNHKFNPSRNESNSNPIEDIDFKKNPDFYLINLVGIVIMLTAIITLGGFTISYSIGIGWENNPYILLIGSLFVVFITNSVWALIQSLLSSIFPKNQRNFWVSALYNGGLAIGFVAPFLSMQIMLSTELHFLLLLPLLLGGIAMISGSLLYLSTIKKSLKTDRPINLEQEDKTE